MISAPGGSIGLGSTDLGSTGPGSTGPGGPGPGITGPWYSDCTTVSFLTSCLFERNAAAVFRWENVKK